MIPFLLLLGCESAAPTPTETGDPTTCAADQLLDDAGICVPIGCGSTAWGTAELGASAVYVLAGASGGDGAEASPYGAIGDALEAGATEIYVGSGTYPEFIAFKKGDPATIAGRCAEMVTLDTSSSEEHGIDLIRGAELTVSGFTVTGAPHIGVAVSDSTLTLTDVLVSGNSWHGVNVYGAGTLKMSGGGILDTQPVDGEGGYGLIVQEGSTATLTGATISRNAGMGMGIIGVDSEVTLHGVTVSGTVPSDGWGDGAWVLDGAKLVADEGTVFRGNTATGISVSTMTDPSTITVELTDTTIADTVAYVIDELSAEAVGLLVRGNAEVSLSRCTFTGNPTGVLAWGADPDGNPYSTHIDTRKSTFTGVTELPDVGESTLMAPAGIAAYLGAIVEDVGSTFSSGFTPGILADTGAQLTLTDTRISDIATASGQLTMGLLVTEGSGVSATGVEISDVAGAGVQVTGGSTFTAENLVITGIHAAALGDAGALSEGIYVFDADVTVNGATLTDIDGLGIALRQGSATLTDILIRDVHRISPETPGEGITAQSLEGDGATMLSVAAATITEVDGLGIFMNGPMTTGTLAGITISDGLNSTELNTGVGPAGVVVQAGASATLTSSSIHDQPGVGILVNGSSSDPSAEGVVDAVLTATDVTIDGVRADRDNPAIGIIAQAHARFTGERIDVSGAGDVGLYAVIASLECTDCTVDDFGRAGVVAQAAGLVALHNTAVTGAGSTAFGLYGSGRIYPASILFDQGSVVEGGGLAGVYIDGAGAWALTDCDVGGGLGGWLGDVLVQGNAIFGYQTAAWDEETATGLSVERCSLHGGAGPGLLLQEGTATVCDVSFADNAVDVVWQSCPAASEPESCGAADLGVYESCPDEAPYSYVNPASLGLFFIAPDQDPQG